MDLLAAASERAGLELDVSGDIADRGYFSAYARGMTETLREALDRSRLPKRMSLRRRLVRQQRMVSSKRPAMLTWVTSQTERLLRRMALELTMLLENSRHSWIQVPLE
jgi:hypothetical protein